MSFYVKLFVFFFYSYKIKFGSTPPIAPLLPGVIFNYLTPEVFV